MSKKLTVLITALMIVAIFGTSAFTWFPGGFGSQPPKPPAPQYQPFGNHQDYKQPGWFQIIWVPIYKTVTFKVFDWRTHKFVKVTKRFIVGYRPVKVDRCNPGFHSDNFGPNNNPWFGHQSFTRQCHR